MKSIIRILMGTAAVATGIFSGQALDLVPSGNTRTLVAYFSATGNIREPQNDDDGIDLPNRPSQVEGWLRRMGLLNSEAGIEGVENESGEITVATTPGGIQVSPAGRSLLAVYDTTGRAAHSSIIEHTVSVPLDSGIYLVKVSSPLLSSTRKILVK